MPVAPPNEDADSGRIARRVKADNPPNLVRKLAAALRDRGDYEAIDEQVESGKVDEALYQAILKYQATLDDPYPANAKKKHTWPDGVVDVPGYTWNHLFPPEKPHDDPSDDDDPADEPPRTDNVLYCLLMHLAPVAIDDLPPEVSWVTRARVAGPAQPADETGDVEGYGADEIEGAAPDADYILTKRVKKGSTNTADVEWVEQRLIDVGLLDDRSAPTGVADDAFDHALREFQRTYVWPDDAGKCDGVVSVGQRTDAVLRKDDEALAEIEADVAEAHAHELTSAVFEGSTNPDDTRWVEARLIRFGVLTARTTPTGIADADLGAAITEFQRAYPWSHKPKNCDGVVDKGGKTHKYLLRTQIALDAGGGSGGGGAGGGGGKSAAPDSAFVAAIEGKDADGLAAVVSGLSVSVGADESIWPCGVTVDRGESGAEAESAAVHWEIFSETLLFASWDTVDDALDDLIADVPPDYLDEIDRDGDAILSAEEVATFYADKPDARDFRRTACRFLSEWGTDIDRTVARLDAVGFGTAGLATELHPYQWWSHAADVLPASPRVWHFNPIELIAVYQELLDAHAPPSAADPATQGSILVRIVADNGMPPKSPPTVEVWWAGVMLQEAPMGRDGTAIFRALNGAPGYSVFLTDEIDRMQPVEVVAGATAEVTLRTDRPGKKIPYGDLTVWVRSRGAAVGAVVTLTDASGTTLGPLTVGKKSRVVFEGLGPGKVRVAAVYDETPSSHARDDNDRVDGELEVDFMGKDRKVRLELPRAWSDVTIRYDDGGIPALGTLEDDAGTSLLLPTLGTGEATVRVRRGKYTVRFGKKHRKLKVRFAQTEYAFH